MPIARVPDNFPWPASWKPLPLACGGLGLARSAEAALQSEVCPGHPLYRVACRAVAFHARDPNEFLFATDHPWVPVAFVHLRLRAEADPRWPYTILYSGWGEFLATWGPPRPNDRPGEVPGRAFDDGCPSGRIE